MKKLLILLLILTMLPVALISCGGDGDTTPTPYKILFTVDGKVVHSVTTLGDDVVELPANPEKDGYTFDGWYWDLDTFKRPFTSSTLKDQPYSSDIDVNVYAKFIKNSSTPSYPNGGGGDGYYDPDGWTNIE